MATRAQPCSVPAAAGKPPLERRPLIGSGRALALGRLFKTLANDTRLRLLHALVREDELSVTDLSARLGMAPQAVSNQLQRLADRDILAGRRVGNRVLYRVTDPCVPGLLDLGLCLLEETASAPSARRRSRARTP